MNEKMRQQIMGASQAATSQPAQDEDARHDKNVDKASAAALSMFYAEDSHQDIMGMIPDDDYAGGVALVSATLIEAVDDQSGGNMPDDVIFPASMEVMTDVMQFMGENGIHEFDEKEQSAASMLLIKKLADDYGTTPEQMKEAMAELEQNDVNEAIGKFGNPQEAQAEQAPINQGLLAGA